MRIRKNMKLSSVLLATAGYGGQKLETYVCHLNQSPWDVIPLSSSVEDDGAAELTNLIDSSWFLPSPSSSSPSIIHQFNGEDSFNGNVKLGDSSGAAGRLNTSVQNNRSLVPVQSLNLIAAEDYERSPHIDEMDRSADGDKKSNFLKPDSPVKTSGDDDQVVVSMPAPPKRGRPRGTGKKASDSPTAASKNPYEFYYYSGFGPRWGRKRGGSCDDENIVMSDNRKNCEDNLSKKSSSSGEVGDKRAAFADGSSSFDGFEYMEEDYDVVYQVSEHGKKKEMVMKKMKRGRKPVKERSLKSLM